LATDPLRIAGLAVSLRSDRLVACRGRQLFSACGFWGLQTGPNPTDRAKLGSKRHLICDGRGVPLAIRLTGANRNDSQEALALVDTIPFLQEERGRPRHRPDCVLGDRGYDAEAIRQGLRARHIAPAIAKRNTEHGSGLGRWRWVVERTFAWLNQFRRLRVRYERRTDIHEAFLALACALICWNLLSMTPQMKGRGAFRSQDPSDGRETVYTRVHFPHEQRRGLVAG
jgi:transposase